MDLRVAHPPTRPLMAFDGHCGFCRRWIDRWRQETGDAVEYLPSDDPSIASSFPEIPTARFRAAVQLIEPDGRVSSGAEAVCRALALGGARRWPLRLYETSPASARTAERLYDVVARRRTFFGHVTNALWGRHLERPSQEVVRSVFLRVLGITYAIAFISLLWQIRGLIGHQGILPADGLIAAARQYFDASGIGVDRYRLLPTFCWFWSSDTALLWQCIAGIVLSAVLVAGIAPGLCLTLLWAIYLSLVTVGRDFLAFQWDSLLLETGFLAIFFASWSWRPRIGKGRPPSRLVLWLFRWLLFRLMFESGAVKLLSDDPSWRHLMALTVHYETQPLPTWIGWYAHQLPVWFQRVSCAGVFAVELGAPFLIFAPRRLRLVAAGVLIVFQTLIALTGNYTFFNLLTIALCLLLLDDAALGRLVPAALRRRAARVVRPMGGSAARARRAVSATLAAALVAMSLVPLAAMFGVRPLVLAPAAAAVNWLDAFRSINSYGLFAVMTTTRLEIEVQGSDDGETWRTYEFRYKPGALTARPAFVAPFQPRLDWQMWFAALSTWQGAPWFQDFCLRLLQGSPPVLGLLANNPFPNHPPKYVRAELYEYTFTDRATRAATGAWWARQPRGDYMAEAELPR